MKKVSVIIPVYNNERFIFDTIRSALYQSYKNIEIVIVDDASNDNTKDIIMENFKEKLKQKKIFYIRNEKNLERCESRNKGVKHSSGEYIFFLDHDDMYKNDYIESVIPFFNEYDLIYSIPRTFIDEENRVIRVSNMKYGKIEEEIFSGNIGYSIGIAVKKDCFIGFKNEFLYREDWEFFIRNYISGMKIKVLDNYKILIREHSKRTSNNLKYCYSTLNVLKYYFNGIDNKYKPFILYHTGEVSLRFGKFFKGWKMILSAIMADKKPLLKRRSLENLIKWGMKISIR